MSVRLTQLRSSDGVRIVAAADDSGDAWRIDGVASTFAAGIEVREGDVFEIAAQPLRNPIARAAPVATAVQAP